MNLFPSMRRHLAGFIAPPSLQRPAVSGQRPAPTSLAAQGLTLPVQAGRSSLATALPSGVARIIRPEASARWGILPQLGSITPTYIEQILRGAMAGAHAQQWELFDLMKDTWPRLLKNENELKRGALNLHWELEAEAEEDEAPTPDATERVALVRRAMRQMRARAGHDENGWEGTLTDLMEAWTVGTTVLELLDWRTVNGDVLPRATYWVHPTNYAWAQEGFLGLSSAIQNSQLGTRNSVAPFPEHKFLVAICKAKSGHPLSGALLRPLAWWWCAANFSADWLLNFAQIFGMPIRWAHYPTGTPQATIDAICAMLQNMGSNAWAAFPEGAQVELKESSKGATGSLPQEGILDRADKQCDLLLLGQTLTSDTGGSGAGGGSLALGKVHEGVKEQNIRAIARFAASVLNEQFIPSLLTLNYGNADHAPRFCPEPREQEDQKANAERDAILLGAGMKLPQPWLYKRHNIPLPQGGEEVIGGAPAGAPVSDPALTTGAPDTQQATPPAGPEVGAPEEVQAMAGPVQCKDGFVTIDGHVVFVGPDKDTTGSSKSITSHDIKPGDKIEVRGHFYTDAHGGGTVTKVTKTHVHYLGGIDQHASMEGFYKNMVEQKRLKPTDAAKKLADFKRDHPQPFTEFKSKHDSVVGVTQAGVRYKADHWRDETGKMFPVKAAAAEVQAAAAPSALPTPHSAFASALSADLGHAQRMFLDRLDAILAITDPVLRAEKVNTLFAQIKADISADPASAHALTDVLASAFAQGIATKAKP